MSSTGIRLRHATMHTTVPQHAAAGLLVSIDEAKKTHIQTVLPGIALYALIPRQVIDAMIAKHGILTDDDVTKLRLHLSSPRTNIVIGLVDPSRTILIGLTTYDTE
jgi:hypothetical protein